MKFSNHFWLVKPYPQSHSVSNAWGRSYFRFCEREESMSEYFEHYNIIQKAGATIVTLVTWATAQADSEIMDAWTFIYILIVPKRDTIPL